MENVFLFLFSISPTAGDFTPVCTTELGKAASLEPDFNKRNVKLCGFSCNDAESHQQWINDILAVTGSQLNFPLFL
jgi:alkyl hydroperoxide reductase subunit AhpC